MAQVNLEEALAAGREAVRRYAWREAFELLSAADQAGGLSADDLDGLAQAAWWNGRSDQCINARERAYALYLESGNPRQAALVALAVAKDQFGRRSSSVGTAWLHRAQRLLKDEPAGVEHGYLFRLQAVMALEGEGDFERALELARQTLEIGTRFGEPDLIALAVQDQGRTLVAKGQVKEGMALLDEATAAALSGELKPLTTGFIYCKPDRGLRADGRSPARRRMDRGRPSLVRSPGDRRVSWDVPRAPGGSHPAPWSVAGGGGRGSPCLRRVTGFRRRVRRRSAVPDRRDQALAR